MEKPQWLHYSELGYPAGFRREYNLDTSFSFYESNPKQSLLWDQLRLRIFYDGTYLKIETAIPGTGVAIQSLLSLWPS